MRRGTWIAIAALVVTATAIFLATLDRSDPSDNTASEPTATTVPALAVESDARHRFTQLDPLVDASDLVVRGRVVAAEPGRVFGAAGESGSAAIRSHVLTLHVDRVLAGSHPAGAGAVALVEEEAELTDGTPVTVDGMRASEVGDDGIWFLAASRDPDFPGYVVVNSQGRYLHGSDGALQGGDPTDPLATELARLGRAGLADAVVHATGTRGRHR